MGKRLRECHDFTCLRKGELTIQIDCWELPQELAPGASGGMEERVATIS